MFPLVFAENRNYGFERNLLAMRPMGIGVALGGLLVLVAVVALKAFLLVHSIGSFDLAVGLLMDVAIVAFWLSFPSEGRVRLAGDKYADQLLDAAAMI